LRFAWTGLDGDPILHFPHVAMTSL
jgi:hypothetical protein